MDFWLGLIFGIFKTATPLLFAASAGLLSERVGIVQIALEGFMLIGALVAAIVGLYFQSAEMGFIAGGFAGLLLAVVFSVFALEFKTDQIIVGTGINILSFGLAPFITKIIYNSTGSTPNLPLEVRFLFAPTIIVALVLALLSYIFYFTKIGLLLRFAGEKPIAIQTAGYSLRKIRWLALLTTGLLAGFGGASLSLFLASSYAPQMTAGRGFIALAALILGRWRPLTMALAVLFFAAIDAIPLILQYFELNIPGQWVQAIPYIITIVAVAGLFGGSQAPAALGQRE